MKTSAVTTLVTERASRFGAYNPQQLKLLISRLGKVAEAEVAHGLLHVFTHGAAPPDGSPAQELAGRLLVALQPRAEIDLYGVLRASLARYELSVEQLPLYLRFLCGKERILVALQEIEHESLAEQELRALKTMRFWLGNTQGQNSH